MANFDCGDKDLNEFLKEDAIRYQDNKMANTIVLIEKERVVGFFSLCTDAIKLGNLEKDQCDNLKPSEEYPAVKIARLAVDKSVQSLGLGKLIIQVAVGLIIARVSNIVGTRFITVDSYHNRIDFYKRFGFNEHSKYKKKDNYVSMRYDLLNPK